MPPLLQVQDLTKSYATPVLREVSLALQAGEIHALVGENGAGKSTFCRILAGLTPPDSGRFRLDGRPYQPRSRRDAEAHGISMVLQELNLIPTLTVAENMFLESFPHRWGWIRRDRLRAAARELLGRLGLGHIDPDRPVAELGIGEQQLVEIAAGFRRRCRLLILDEPTAALTDPEIDRLFRQIRAFRDQGGAVLYISHRLEEIRRLADRVTVLRDGRIVASRPAAEVSSEELVRLMVGRELETGVDRAPTAHGAVALEVRGLQAGPRVRGVGFALHYGEILGLAGLMGAGRTETLRAVFGADRAEAGEIRLGGDGPAIRFRSPSQAVRAGLGLVTEDRKSEGLLLPQPVRVNLTLPGLGRFRRGPGWIDAARETAETAAWIRRLGIRCASPEQPVGELSGGNQQKVVVARWLLRGSRILLFDEPTRGIDVGARFELHRLLREQADQGRAVLVVSSDLKELMTLCDRILVLSGGRVTGEFRRGEWSEDAIMRAAFAAHLQPNHPGHE
ncbi:MAG: sugar ABC transporter ATP-binding protein [Verrucomicrobia bacterium]|nr:MAG: sugar ABC transporter ATP-binding protein [Verrucomicrobiota bacterium]